MARRHVAAASTRRGRRHRPSTPRVTDPSASGLRSCRIAELHKVRRPIRGTSYSNPPPERMSAVLEVGRHRTIRGLCCPAYLAGAIGRSLTRGERIVISALGDSQRPAGHAGNSSRGCEDLGEEFGIATSVWGVELRGSAHCSAINSRACSIGSRMTWPTDRRDRSTPSILSASFLTRRTRTFPIRRASPARMARIHPSAGTPPRPWASKSRACSPKLDTQSQNRTEDR